jgi:hypothetical protein
MECEAIVTSQCSRNHSISRKCHDKAAAACKKCEIEDREQERKRRRDHKLDQERQAQQIAYARQLARIEDDMDHQKRILKERKDDSARQNALSQKQQDLANLKARVQSQSNSTSINSSTAKTQSKPPPASETLPSRLSPPKTTLKTQPYPNVPQQNDISAKEPKGHMDQDRCDMSESKDDWEYQKEFEGAENAALDSLMRMIGETGHIL